MTADFVVAMQQYKPESLMWALFIISLCLAVPPLGWEYLGSLLGSNSVSPLCHEITGTCKLAKGAKDILFDVSINVYY